MTVTRRVVLIAIALAMIGVLDGLVLSSSQHRPTLDPSCTEDAQSVETAAYAYQGQIGTFPRTVAALMKRGTTGPWLKEAPRSDRYSLSINPDGDVIVHSLTGVGGGDWAQIGPKACNL